MNNLNTHETIVQRIGYVYRMDNNPSAGKCLFTDPEGAE